MANTHTSLTHCSNFHKCLVYTTPLHTTTYVHACVCVVCVHAYIVTSRMSNNNRRSMCSAELYTPSLSHLCFSLCIPDPSLNPENLSNVLDIMKDWLWEWFSQCVNIPESEIEKIRRQYAYGSDRKRKQAIIPHIISTHPSLSWTLVAHVLYQMVPLSSPYLSDVDDDLVSCHSSLDLLQQKFPTGNTCSKGR